MISNYQLIPNIVLYDTTLRPNNKDYYFHILMDYR